MTIKVIPVRVGADEEGDRERRPVRKDDLQEPSGLTCSQKASYHRHHGETRPGTGPDTLKTMSDISVCTLDQPLRRLECCQSPAIVWHWLGGSNLDPQSLLFRIERPPAQPGVQSSTYRVKGPSSEHETLKLSAGAASTGKPPGQAMSQLRRRVSIVVRAWESHAHGEGRQ